VISHVPHAFRADARPAWLEAWLRSQPDNADAWLVAGKHSIAHAWHIRGSGYASTVTGPRFCIFFDVLRRAETELAHAAELAPADPTPWAELLTSGRGLQSDPSLIRARFAELVARDAHHLAGHMTMLQYRCAKWHGSNAEMFAFARQVSVAAPEGSELHVLIAMAHLEYIIREEDSDAVPLTAADAARELLEAAQRSVLSREHRATRSTRGVRNTLACALWATRQYADAKRQFEAIGDDWTSHPWNYFGQPFAVFTAARRDCEQRAL
jgi:hypothetical protein